ncbi:hypothetical protein BH10PSE9_BH10PSE9_14320 [soil metagenome]
MNAILLLSIAAISGLILLDVGCYFGLRHVAARRLSSGRQSHS